MISIEEALLKILEAIPTLSAENVALSECLGRTLAEDLFAKADNPPFDNSAMDGYALISRNTAGASIRNPVELRLSGKIEAGCGITKTLGEGQTARILTGAPVPPGADAVVIQEVTEVADGEVRVFEEVKLKENIRFSGEDMRQGDLILTRGRTLGPLEVALLASQGIVRVSVARRPKTMVVTTGSEIVSKAEPLAFGKVRNSNGPCLVAAVQRAGAQAFDRGIVGDRPEELRNVFLQALDEADILLVSGGVSVGDRDFTRMVLEELGMETGFWKVASKPGKPLLFGMRGSTAVFGIPGNPVSAWVCFEEFVRPAIDKMLGKQQQDRWHLKGRVLTEYPVSGKRQQYLFCQARRDGEEFVISIIRPQGSAMLGMAARANALALAPAGVQRIRVGDILTFRWIE